MKWTDLFLCTVNVSDGDGAGGGSPASSPVVSSQQPTGAKQVGNTYWYPTLDAWKAAGSPGGNDVYNVKIGQPNKGSYQGDATTVGGKTIGTGENQYNPVQAPTYKPPAPPPASTTGTTQSSSGARITAATTAKTPQQVALAFDVQDVDKRIDDYKVASATYASHYDAFNLKWDSKIQNGLFVGSDGEFKQYKADHRTLDNERIDLDIQVNEVNHRVDAVNKKQDAELAKLVAVGKGEYIAKDDWDKLDPKYRAILKSQGFDALNTEIDTANKAAIKQALIDTFDRFKDDKGRTDLVSAVKAGLSEKTIAIAFGEDAARNAVNAAGPAPAGGWGPKGPNLLNATVVVTSETLFPPAKQWVEPELHYKATGMDWAIGGAQVALFALPLVGLAGKAGLAAVEAGQSAAVGSAAAKAAASGARLAMGAKIASVGIQAGATAIFTKDTIDNFDELKKNPWQLAFAIGMDALIADGALRAISAKLSPGSRIAAKVAEIARNEKGGTIPGTKAPPEVEVNAAGEKKGFGTGGSLTKEQYQAQVQKAAEARNKPQPWDITPQQKAQIAEEQAKLQKSMNDAHDALRAGDAEALKKSGREMLTWSEHHPNSVVSDLIDRRANDFIKNADDYAKLRDIAVQAKEGPRPIEGKTGAKIPETTGSTASESLTKGAHDAKASSSGAIGDYERIIEQRISQAEQIKQDGFYRDHKLPSWVTDRKVGESVQDHAQRVRDYLEEQYGRSYIEERLDLTQAERDAIAKDVMKEHLDTAVDGNEATLDQIDKFLKEDRGKEDWRPGKENTPASEDRGGGTAVKEKTEVETKTKEKTKVEQEAEKILEEKEAKAKPKEEVKPEERTKAGEKTGEKVGEDVKATDKAKPTEAPKEKATPFERASPAIEPRPHTGAQEEHLESVGSKPIEQTKGGVQPVTVPVVSVRPSEQANSKPREQVNPQPKEQVQPSPSGAAKVKPVPGVKPAPEVRPQPHPEPFPQPHPPDVKLKTKVKEPLRDKPKDEGKKEWTQADIASATALKVGMFWVLQREDGQVRFFKKLPEGVQNVEGGKGSGKRSVQTVKGDPLDSEIKLGFITAHINKPTRAPGKPGGVNYVPERRPPLNATRQGDVLHIQGVGFKRGKAPKGRLVHG